MKKLLYLLLALPLLAMISCSDDDKDLPDVSIGFSYSGATDVDGTLYNVRGDTLSIDSVFCTPAEGTKPAAIANVTYVFDGLPLGYTPISPFAIDILTSDVAAGRHTLTLEMTVLQEGKSIGTAWMPLPVAVVDTITDIPAGASPSTHSTYRGTASFNN